MGGTHRPADQERAGQQQARPIPSLLQMAPAAPPAWPARQPLCSQPQSAGMCAPSQQSADRVPAHQLSRAGNEDLRHLRCHGGHEPKVWHDFSLPDALRGPRGDVLLQLASVAQPAQVHNGAGTQLRGRTGWQHCSAVATPPPSLHAGHEAVSSAAPQHPCACGCCNWEVCATAVPDVFFPQPAHELDTREQAAAVLQQLLVRTDCITDQHPVRLVQHECALEALSASDGNRLFCLLGRSENGPRRPCERQRPLLTSALEPDERRGLDDGPTMAVLDAQRAANPARGREAM
eukprot:356027-Chlamydomonas_euryale.AAC.4